MMRRLFVFTVLAALCLVVAPAPAQEEKPAEPVKPKTDAEQEAKAGAEKKPAKKKSPLNSGTLAALKLRGIGPALMSGRIADIAIHPKKRNVWFVAVACGGVWKTENAGTTWKPIFDGQGSYSIGCVAIDAKTPDTVWVGTGENNSQRSVGFGDGVYKSVDGGKSWKKAGLANSEHIGKILIHPRHGDTVYVAAQGPLWKAGGDRGLYKTTDGGKTWRSLIEVDEHTGVSDLAFDPRDPSVIYASTYQRRRRQWTLINGGPGSALWKTTDAGKTWTKLARGLPGGNVGRIGLAVSPQQPDVVYALVEASGSAGGFFRSMNGGTTWRKMSSYNTTSAQYYQKIYACPFVFDRIYSMDVRFQVSEDGGKTWQQQPQRFKHVDNHALAFQPADPNYLLCGCDGGLYESFDLGKTWKYVANLPITQFYKCCVDNAEPFYHIYGGTQDNNTQGGPVRTLSRHGITNADWFVTLGGDGFKPQVDPKDPNIVYSQYQYGGIRRFDRRTGSSVNIRPLAKPGEDPLRFNWDAPLLISPHSNTRIFYGAQRLFRSDDRGSSWRPVSPDLTRQIDRNKLPVMGKVWPIDAVAKNRSTSFYGTLVAFAESPLVEGLLYTGADDGQLAVSENGGTDWRFVATFPDVPEHSYIADIECSLHDADTVFVVLSNMKAGDFKPYILKSTDRGRTWAPVQGNLPARGPAWALALDHVKPELMFAGTEFGVFVTVDGGETWTQLKGGVPVIAMRDLEIQRRENDLVCASFGRSFYVLDDYTPLREITEASLKERGRLFPVKRTLLYTPTRRMGGRQKGSQGGAFFSAPNPPFGAVFTYWLREVPKSLEAKRKAKEKKQWKKDGKVDYPTWAALRAEEREQRPVLIFTIKDAGGNVVRRLEKSAAKGLHRTTWDLRCTGNRPTSLGGSNVGPRVVPGTYTVSLAIRLGVDPEPLGKPQTFEVAALKPTLDDTERALVARYQMKVGRLSAAISAANRTFGKIEERVRYAAQTVKDQPELPHSLRVKARELELRLADLKIEMSGDRLIARHQEPAPPSIQSWIRRAASVDWNQLPTETQAEAWRYAREAFERWMPMLEAVEAELKSIEKVLDEAGAPWTPGRKIRWKSK